MLYGVEIAELHSTPTVIQGSVVLRFKRRELNSCIQVVQFGIKRQLLVIAVDLAAIQKKVSDREVENIDRLALFILHRWLRNIAVTGLIHTEVNYRVINYNLVQAHLASEQRDDLQAHGEMVDSQ